MPTLGSLMVLQWKYEKNALLAVAALLLGGTKNIHSSEQFLS
jgi:hypothetical protein